MAKAKKKIEKKEVETVKYSIKLAKKHPNNKMQINGVLISGYVFKNYDLPADTNLDSKEIETWFVIEDPIKEKKAGKSADDSDKDLDQGNGDDSNSDPE